MTKDEIQKLISADHLTTREISKRTITQIRPDLLYRTHVALHKEVDDSELSRKMITAHRIVADEILARGLMHHQWDKLDTHYTK